MSLNYTKTEAIDVLNTARPTVANTVATSPYDMMGRASGFLVSKSLLCDGSGAQLDNIFTLIGRCEVLRLYGVATAVGNATTFGTTYFDLWDGTAALEITDNGGTNLAGIAVGGFVCKDLVATSPLSFKSVAAGTFTDGGGAGYFTTFCPFRVGKKSGATTTIRFCFTGDGSTSVTMKFYVEYFPLTDDGAITAA